MYNFIYSIFNRWIYNFIFFTFSSIPGSNPPLIHIFYSGLGSVHWSHVMTSMALNMLKKQIRRVAMLDVVLKYDIFWLKPQTAIEFHMFKPLKPMMHVKKFIVLYFRPKTSSGPSYYPTPKKWDFSSSENEMGPLS